MGNFDDACISQLIAPLQLNNLELFAVGLCDRNPHIGDRFAMAEIERLHITAESNDMSNCLIGYSGSTQTNGLQLRTIGRSSKIER